MPRFRLPVEHLLVHRERLGDDEVVVLNGVRLTTPPWTVFDLARWRTPVEGVVGVDAVAHRFPIGPRDLCALAWTWRRSDRRSRNIPQLSTYLMLRGSRSPMLRAELRGRPPRRPIVRSVGRYHGAVTDAPAVLLERDAADPAVAVLTLNRPARYNALTNELKSALLAAVRELSDADDLRALVLTGAGKGFCVGQDLGEHAAALRGDAATSFDTVTEHYNPIITGLVELPFPVVAAINGPCAGAGLGFALACDLRIAAAGLAFSPAFTGIGLTADSGLSANLAHAVGVSRALELLLLNETFSAEDALAWGLVRSVVPAAEVLPAARELARRLAAGPTRAYAEVKRAVRQAAVSDLPSVLAAEAAAQARLAGTADHVAAVEDFLHKRRPSFVGR